MPKYLSVLLLLTLSFHALAQITWEKINSPNESVTALTSTSNGDAFLGTTNYGVFQSTDGGMTWDNISQGLGDLTVRSMAASSDDAVFAGTGANGIYRYSAGTWTPINTGLPAGNLLSSAFAKGSNGEMYLITVSDDVYKWNGTTWTSIKFNLPALARVIAVSSIGEVFVGCFNSGVYKFNGVNAWTTVGAMPNSFVTKMVMGPTDMIYVACNSNNVYKIPATGGTWTSINTGLPALNATTMGIDAQNNLYLAYNVGNYGKLYRSTNSGGTWSPVANALNTGPFFSFCAHAFGQVYVGGAGVYQTTDGGNTWNDLNPGLDARKTLLSFTAAANNMFYVAIQGGGVWRSDDNGVTWQQKTTGLSTFNSIQITTAADGSLLFNAYFPGSTTMGVIFRSTNNGDTWTQVASNGTDLYTKIKQDNGTGRVWACGRFGGPVLSYSTNNGATWTNNPIPNFSAIWDIEFGANNTLFVGSESEGVSRSTNGGVTWEEGVGNSIPWYGNVIEVEMDQYGNLFAATDWYNNMVWFSPSGSNGGTWTKFLDADLNGLNDIYDLVFDNQNNAYIATNNGPYKDPIYRANNAVWHENTPWVSVSNGLPSNAVAGVLAFDAGGYLYAVLYFDGTEGGLYRSTAPVNTPLPIHLISFDGVVKGDHHQLTWQTATEVNNDRFEVMRSGDGIHFEKIGAVYGAGNSQSTLRYDFEDASPLDGINYYRLKQIGQDGSFEYSKVLALDHAKHARYQLYPNPVQYALSVQTPSDGFDYQIVNAFGQVVQTGSGSNQRSILVADLATGIYALRIDNQLFTFVKH